MDLFTHRRRIVGSFIGKLLFLWLKFHLSSCTETDIHCLRTIKDTLEDPHNSFSSSWVFDNLTDIEGSICYFVGVDCWHAAENRVLRIQLSYMGLKGQFPRGIQYCSSLTTLDLSGNDLSGPIPSDISLLLKFVTALDLSSNKFSGEIPKDLANCNYLNVLKLDHNQFSGDIPSELGLLGRITTFTVVDNLLSGPVPQFNSKNITLDSYKDNPGLCGGPFRPCKLRSESETRTWVFVGGAVGFLGGFMGSVWFSSKLLFIKCFNCAIT